ncbi:MAG: RDD family protein [Prosthecobacter sp.]|jgi:uncharacterized RDD family membrane protein YckC|uniref:RDD family protein n=1 Tax=Prosthecobacter sp. TaxID=1965333 RepID=UPI0019E71FA1|nr:RDD family protein [Prosthecobacter sp.]MBE2286703.1 RDD family protein [Prosthecobacter sp.]
MTYHVAKNGAQLGQLSEEDIQQRLQRGELSADDLCWAEGMTDWQPLGACIALASSPVVVPSAFNPYAPPSANITVDRPAGSLGGHPGFWIRVAAHIIDAILMGIAGAVMGAIVGFSMAAAGNATASQIELAANLLGIVLNWLYYAFMESSSSQGTLGKKALGIVVTDLQGRRISFARATGRYFGQIVSAVTLCIGYMMCGWTERKQCLHDMMAGCLLYRKTA